MREIKFRGKRKYGTEMLIGDLVRKCNGGPCIFPNDVDQLSLNSPDWFEIDPNTLGQFTNGHDCSGVEIFEGDILEWRSSNPFSLGETRRVKVYFIGNHFWCNGSIGIYLGELLTTEKVKRIGNIYQNPELLNPTQP